VKQGGAPVCVNFQGGSVMCMALCLQGLIQILVKLCGFEPMLNVLTSLFGANVCQGSVGGWQQGLIQTLVELFDGMSEQSLIQTL
jgi:hypothetical protein